ncbi:MAG: IS701 family transposase [Planctomycetota bacterium]|nr:IS701 family transposase [Planctomycetota bacterium]
MPAIVEFPAVVKEALEQFGHLFANEPERVHFAEYLTGLLVAARKNVSAINREFVDSGDQSCLNRWLTEADWDAGQLNQARLDWLQKEPSTRYSSQGVIALDNVLIDHDGKLIDDVGWFWDHAEDRNKIAHDYLIVNYGCTSGKHYPLEFRRFIKRDACEQRNIAFRDHNDFFRELVDWVIAQGIPGDFTFDSWFTHAANLNHIHGHRRGYVGDLKFNRKIVFQRRTLKAEELAGQIAPTDRKPLDIGEERQWYFTKSVPIPDVKHPVRLVILWAHRNDNKPRKILVTNRTYWEVTRIVRVYRNRWRGTECFHRDGKQHLGMGDCQIRNGLGQTRHQYLVFLAHSILMRQLRQTRASAWALERLTTIGQACRAVLRETLGTTISWVLERFSVNHWSCEMIKQQLALPGVCRSPVVIQIRSIQ